MRLKLKYESMTVMKIGYFGDFYNRFDEILQYYYNHKTEIK